MRYEQFLFTRNQERDFTPFVRPAGLTNKDVSAIGNIFNYVHEIARLSREFPSLYCFPIGEYFLLVRHYNSGRRHAGRAIGVIEGIAAHQSDGGEFARALPGFVADPDRLIVPVVNIEQQDASLSTVFEWHGGVPERLPDDTFVDDFLHRIDEDRLFVPFTRRGLTMLRAVLSHRPYAAPPLFAFGTNSSVVGEFDARGISLDVVSYFNTDLPAYRSRTTGQKTGAVTGFPWEADDDPLLNPSMAIRPPVSDDTLPEPLGERLKDRLAAADTPPSTPPAEAAQPPKRRDLPDSPISDETPLLTIREMRDRIRAETQQEPPPPPTGFDPLRWIVRLFESLVSKHK
jgi:hypothetical protein